MQVREFLTKWGFTVEHDKLDKVEKQLEGIKHRLDFLAGVEIIKGLYELTERFSKIGEQLHIASEAAGISVESFQKLAFSAQQSGVEQEAMGKSLNLLSRHLNDARHGSDDAVKAFRRIGISGDQLKSFHTSREALLAISDRFKGMTDPIEKTAAAQNLLGRNSAKMVAFLNQGSAAIKEQGDEAEKLGLILSGGQIKALESLEHTLQKVWALFKAVSATIAANVAPVMEYLIKDFMAFTIANRDLIQNNVEGFLMKLAFGLGFVWELIKIGIDLVVRLAKAFGFEGNILSIGMAFVGMIGGALALFKIIQWGIGIWGMFSKAISFSRDVLALFEGVSWSAIAPWLPFAAALGLVVFAFHDLWKAMHGEKTWIQSLMEMAGVANFVNNAFQKMFEWIFKIGSAVGSAFKGIGKLFGFQTPGDISAKMDAAGGQGPGMNPGAITNLNQGGDAANSFQNNISVTVNGAHGNPNEIGKAVADHVAAHTDRMMRETKQNVKNAKAY
jgi:hypothetical protein